MKHKSLVLPQEHERSFQARISNVCQTAEKLDLNPESAVIIGGAGLALHGLNASVDTNRFGSFDVDAFITQTKLEDITEHYSRYPSFFIKADPFSHQISLKRPLTRLPFTGLSGAWCNFGQLNSYRVTADKCVERNGLPTLPATTLATMKLHAGRRKDVTGLLQAHVIGESQGHPIVSDPSWQALIATAISRIQASEDVAIHGETHYPSWMTELVAIQFEHSAFEGIAC